MRALREVCLPGYLRYASAFKRCHDARDLVREIDDLTQWQAE